MSDNFGRIIVTNSCWSLLFVLLIIIIGYKSTKYGITILLLLFVFFAVYFDHEINHNDDIEIK